MEFKSVFFWVAKLAAALFLACVALIACFAGYEAIKKAQDERAAKPLEEVKFWSSDLTKPLGLKFSARTKLVGGVMYIDLVAQGFPEYLSNPAMWEMNRSATFSVVFNDADGFKVFEKEIKVGEFSRLVGGDGKHNGLSIQIDQPLGVDRYKAINNMGIGWTLQTSVPAAGPQSSLEERPLDHCAPGLSKAERLKRLAAHGQVREAGAGTYRAGSHKATYIGGELFDCE